MLKIIHFNSKYPDHRNLLQNLSDNLDAVGLKTGIVKRNKKLENDKNITPYNNTLIYSLHDKIKLIKLLFLRIILIIHFLKIDWIYHKWRKSCLACSISYDISCKWE